MTSILKVDTIQGANGSDIPYIKGHVLQMPFTQYTSTTSVSCTANTDTTVDVLTLTITPKSTSSIIRLDTHIFHEWSNAESPHDCAWFFYRDSIKLAHAQVGNRRSGISTSVISYRLSDADSTPEKASYSYFDAPNTTSQITYKVGIITQYTSTLYINRTVADTNAVDFERGLSFISATEIGG